MTEWNSRIERIVSGGQTGVDRAALDAALELKLPHGGWCPLGRRAEDGVIPVVYQLQETGSRDYAERTEKNVLDSDGTLIVSRGEPSGGTKLTHQFAVRHSRPCFVVDLRQTLGAAIVQSWLDTHQIRILNVAGPRESGSPGIGDEARQFIVELLRLNLHDSAKECRSEN